MNESYQSFNVELVDVPDSFADAVSMTGVCTAKRLGGQGSFLEDCNRCRDRDRSALGFHSLLAKV